MNVVFDSDGLVPAIIQDDETAAVLMLGWMNQHALDATFTTGLVHFWSRSRQALWQKGETSGNALELVGIDSDCDADALLVRVRPRGPVCHTGEDTCWGPSSRIGLAGLDHVWSVIANRAANLPPGSYTTQLLTGGPDAAARKVGEEALEVILAAKDHAAGAVDDRRVAEELADLLYHLLVLAAERGIAPNEIMTVLAERRH
jgi:phosphoribosyl-AMP cyclohydrolase / phosphoribosyl-ATP pyrophosphohydrolase